MTYTSDGTLVSTYGSNPAFDLSDFSPTAYLIAGDGDLLVGGNTISTNVPEVVAFTGDDLDTSFGTDGITTLRIFPTALDNADHSQIWVSGTDDNTSTNYLARLNSDGSIDTTFGPDGYAAGTVSSDDVTVDDNGLQRLYAEYNADYSITSLTDSSGDVVERYTYDPYGNVTVMNPDGTTLGDGTPASSNYNWIYLDQGMRFSVSTGTYATETRVYSPSLGRPLQEDPAGYVNGPSRSQWELSNPVNSLDPTGLWSPMRWLYTGDGNASDEVYDAATSAGGEEYTQDAGQLHNNLQQLGHVPGAGLLAKGTDAALTQLEGGSDSALHRQVMGPPSSNNDALDHDSREREQRIIQSALDAFSWYVFLSGLSCDGNTDPDPEETSPEKPPCFLAGTQVLVVSATEAQAAAQAQDDLMRRRLMSDLSEMALCAAPIVYLLSAYAERRRFLRQAKKELDAIEPMKFPLIPGRARCLNRMSMSGVNFNVFCQQQIVAI